MYYKKCGEENKEQNKVCNKCGYNLKNTNIYFTFMTIIFTVTILLAGIFPFVSNYFADKENTILPIKNST